MLTGSACAASSGESLSATGGCATSPSSAHPSTRNGCSTQLLDAHLGELVGHAQERVVVEQRRVHRRADLVRDAAREHRSEALASRLAAARRRASRARTPRTAPSGRSRPTRPAAAPRATRAGTGPPVCSATRKPSSRTSRTASASPACTVGSPPVNTTPSSSPTRVRRKSSTPSQLELVAARRPQQVRVVAVRTAPRAALQEDGRRELAGPVHARERRQPADAQAS